MVRWGPNCKDEPPPARDSQVNCKVCLGCAHIREDLDMTDVRCIDDLVTYFQKAIKAREKKSDQEKRRKRKKEKKKIAERGN